MSYYPPKPARRDGLDVRMRDSLGRILDARDGKALDPTPKPQPRTFLHGATVRQTVEVSEIIDWWRTQYPYSFGGGAQGRLQQGY